MAHQECALACINKENIRMMMRSRGSVRQRKFAVLSDVGHQAARNPARRQGVVACVRRSRRLDAERRGHAGPIRNPFRAGNLVRRRPARRPRQAKRPRSDSRSVSGAFAGPATAVARPAQPFTRSTRLTTRLARSSDTMALRCLRSQTARSMVTSVKSWVRRFIEMLSMLPSWSAIT